ncbi:MAG TPA: PAS domain-containing protein [Mucilaginibacter sp.]|nr:PAS domain-containing protein [Mucilaginibacter sp.]
MITENYLKGIFKSLPAPVMILLPDAPVFTIVDVNDAYLGLNEFTREECIGKGLFGITYSGKNYEMPGWAESLEKVVTKKKPDKLSLRKYEVSLPDHAEDTSRYWEIDHIPILNDDNEVSFIVRYVSDQTHIITARKNTEQALTESRDKFYSLLQTIEGIVWEADADTLQFTFVSDHAKQILGYSPKQWLEQPRFWENHFYPADREEVLNYYNLKLRPFKSYTFEYRMTRADGNVIWIKDIVSLVKGEGNKKWLRGLMLDVTASRRLSSLENLERNVLELNSKNAVSLREILSYYLSGVEALFPQMLCSILEVKNNRLFDWASPSLPAAYIKSIENLPISENGGSCGTAAHLKKKIIVSDIATDPRWADYKNLALTYGLRACWSYPIINAERKVMATLGMYYKEIKKPNDEELKVIERVTAILKIILENRQRAEIIAETNMLMTQSQELAQFGNWRWDVQTNVVSWSDSLYTIYGLNKSNFKATFEGYQELLHPEDRERVYNIILNVLNTGEDMEFEERIIRPTGEMRYLKSWGKLKCDSRGNPVEMIGACIDITESKMTQEVLQESESRLRALSDSQTNYVIRIGLDGKFTYLNKKYIEDFNWILKNEVLTDTNASITVQPYHGELVKEIMEDCIKNPDRVNQVEIDHLRDDGRIRPTLWHFIGLTNSKGETTEIQCIGLDITDLKNVQKALKISNERYEYVNMATNDAIFDWNLVNGRIKWGNGFFRLFGLDSKENYTYKNWLQRVHPDDTARVEGEIKDTLADNTQGNWSGEYRFKKADDTYAHVEGNGYIIRDDEGNGIRMIGVVRDITERLNYITAIEKQNEKLLEIAWMQSHVVRAPLARVIGLADLIKDFPANGEEETNILDHLINGAYELDDIIRDISKKTENIDLKQQHP